MTGDPQADLDAALAARHPAAMLDAVHRLVQASLERLYAPRGWGPAMTGLDEVLVRIADKLRALAGTFPVTDDPRASVEVFVTPPGTLTVELHLRFDPSRLDPSTIRPTLNPAGTPPATTTQENQP